jgi:hypothetical protein
MWQALRHLPDNPLLRYLLRRSLRPAQLGALVVYTIILIGIVYLLRSHPLVVGPVRPVYIAIIWAMTEFILAWMAADQIMSEHAGLRRSGLWGELRLSRLGPAATALAPVAATTLFIAPMPIIVALATPLIPWDSRVLAPEPAQPLEPLLPALLALHGIATVWLTAAVCLSAAVAPRSAGRIERAWFLALCRVAGLILLALSPALFPVLAHFPGGGMQRSAGYSLWMGVLIGMAELAYVVLPGLMATLLLVCLPAKVILAVVYTRRAARLLGSV